MLRLNLRIESKPENNFNNDNKNNMKNLKDWKTTIMGIATLLTFALNTFNIDIPSNINEVLVVLSSVLLMFTKDPDNKGDKKGGAK